MKFHVTWDPGAGLPDSDFELADVHPFVDSARVAGIIQQTLFRIFGHAVQVRSLEPDVYRPVFDETRQPTYMNPRGFAVYTIPGAQQSLANTETTQV